MNELVCRCDNETLDDCMGASTVLPLRYVTTIIQISLIISLV